MRKPARRSGQTKIETHASAGITGAPIVYDGRLYIGVQGPGEEGRGSANGYSCCTFRGSLYCAGHQHRQVLEAYTIDESKPRAKSRTACRCLFRSQAAAHLVRAPSVDVKRGLVYAATRQCCADPVQQMTNGVIAFDLRTGAVRWHKQLLPADNWAMGCQAKNPGNPACPETLGPDYDFSATPILTRAGKRDLIVIPQKSAIAYALDPDKQGAVVWQRAFGKGSGLGGQWGAAADGVNFYTGTNDFLADAPGGMTAISLTDGHIVWQHHRSL